MIIKNESECKTKLLHVQMVDILIYHTRSMFGREGSQLLKKLDFLDTKFVSLLVKNFTKFSKAHKKDTHMFQKQLIQFFKDENAKNVDGERFYFPFNFDKTHWVGVCVDCSASIMYILDCNVSLRTDSSIGKELTAVAHMFPYLMRQAGRVPSGRGLKPFSIERLRNIPQNGKHSDSALTAILLIQAHAIGGVEACQCITPENLQFEAQRLLVMMFEEHCQLL